MGSILRPYEMQELIIIFALITDVTLYSSKKEDTSARHKNTYAFEITEF